MINKIIITIFMLSAFCFTTISSAAPLERKFPVQITFKGDYHTIGDVGNASLGFMIVNPYMMAPNEARDGGMFPDQTITSHIGIGWEGSLQTLILVYNGDQTSIDGPENFCIVNATLDPDTGLLSKADVLRSNSVQPTPADRVKPIYCDVSVKGQEILIDLSCRSDTCDY